MTNRRCVSGLILLALIYWAMPESPAPPIEPNEVEQTKSDTPRIKRNVPVTAEPERIVAKLPQELLHIVLRTDEGLQKNIAIFNRFEPRELTMVLEPEGLPDTPTGDAIAAWLASDDTPHRWASDDFLDAVDSDPDLEGFGPEWVDIVDLETERLLADEDFAMAEEAVMARLKSASHLPEDEIWEALSGLPPIDRDNSELIALAEEIVEFDPLSPAADIARLYAARGLADPLSARPFEGAAADALLDTLANSESPEVHAQAVRMMVDLEPGSLSGEDIELLEHAWFQVGDDEQGLLSRFLMDQHFVQGDLAEAQLWTDRFETEVLSEEMSLPVREEFLQEVHHAQARIGARLGIPATTWKVAIEQAAWQCWEGQQGTLVLEGDGTLRLSGVWDEYWQLDPSPADHPLLPCLLPAMEAALGPQAPVQVEIRVQIFGVGG